MSDMSTYEIKPWYGKKFSFVQNNGCEYFPCHKTDNDENFNCLFCFCPLYPDSECGGNFTYLENGIKSCCNCMLPHDRACYGYIIEKLQGSGSGEL